MPTKTRKETSNAAVAARGRVLVSANLGWLEGFPLAVEDGCVRWLAVPPYGPAQETAVDRGHLSRATHALNKLRGEQAAALPLLVDEPEAWMAAIEGRLARLKGAVHHAEPPPAVFDDPSLARSLRERAARLAADEPALRPVLGALSWLHAGHPERMRTALGLLPEWAGGAALLADRLGERPGLLVLLRLLQLAADHGAVRVEPLASCLFDAAFHDAALGQGQEFCGQILNGIGKRPKSPLPEELPSGRLGRDLAEWCEEIVGQSHRLRQQTLHLFGLATPRPLAVRWAEWWRETRRLLRQARELAALPYDRKASHQLRARLEIHQKAAPLALAAGSLTEALRGHAVMPLRARTAPLARALALVPTEAEAPGRLQLFLFWSRLRTYGGSWEARVAHALEGVARYLGRRPVAAASALLAPWREIVSTRRYPDTVEADLVDELCSRRTMLAAFDHLADLAARHGPLEPRPAVRAVELLRLAGDGETAEGFFGSLRARGKLDFYYSREASTLAARLCRAAPERFAEVVEALAAQEDRGDLSPSDWPEAIRGPLGAGELGGFVREAIVTRQLDRLLVCGAKSMILAASGTEPLPLPDLGTAREPDWIDRYPPPLHPALRRLAALLDDAEARVARWLAGDLPDTGRLEREIEALETKLETADEAKRPALATRLANLHARLAAPSEPGPARLERLRAKLERAWGRAVLDGWERRLDARLPAALRRLLEIEAPPPWLSEPGPLALLAAASRLDAPHRRLAYRLFRERCGPPTWDLRDAPQNRRFVEGLPKLDWRPWIEGIGRREALGRNGRRLWLALEDDPLEVFRMGGHFQTCLSPGAVNYFSVFANAADVNKRVLYARDGDGKVVGRCLLALNGQGALLTFEAYCHDGGVKFEKLCADFADDLARRMGTQRVSAGTVPALVAADWYDDGPRDLGGRFACLEPGSALRRRLGELRPDELVAELRRALKPARLNETTLPLVLLLPELQTRPELVLPLLRLVADCRALPDGTVVTAAQLAWQAGAADLVRRTFLHPLAEAVHRSYRRDSWADPRAVDLLLKLDPARLLVILRQTRDRAVHTWLDETYGYRIEALAETFEALHRPRQAQTLWRHLAESPSIDTHDEQRQRARARLKNAARR